jgi:hypothetical protein
MGRKKPVWERETKLIEECLNDPHSYVDEPVPECGTGSGLKDHKWQLVQFSFHMACISGLIPVIKLFLDDPRVSFSANNFETLSCVLKNMSRVDGVREAVLEVFRKSKYGEIVEQFIAFHT